MSGGGVCNPVLFKFLKDKLVGIECKQRLMALVFLPVQRKRLAFAILANEAISGNPGNVPSATGAKESVVLGKIIFAESKIELRENMECIIRDDASLSSNTRPTDWRTGGYCTPKREICFLIF